MSGYARWQDIRAEYVERARLHQAIYFEDGDIAAIA
jgi:hypothetical protein